MPTLTVSEGPTGSPLLTIRGIGSNSAVAGVEPSSTFHLDGVYAGRPAMVSVGLMDVERIEVLRGPQGTLYGRNSVGGTVNIVSRQPTNTLATRGRVLAGADDKLRVEGAVSGPLAANRLMGRFAFLRGSHDGYVKDLEHPDNPLGSEDTWAARGQMRVRSWQAKRTAAVGRLRAVRRHSVAVREGDTGEARLRHRHSCQSLVGACQPRGVR